MRPQAWGYTVSDVDAAALPLESTELIGFMATADSHVARLEASLDRPRPVLLPAYGGTRRLPNLTALLALLLRRYGVPVLLHGPADAGGEFGRVTTAAVLWELGVEPVTSLDHARQRLAHEGIAYAPISLLAPGLTELVALRHETGLRGELHAVVNLIDPFGGAGFRVVSFSREGELRRMREFLAATRADALILRGTEGEPFANPRRQPRLECFAAGAPAVLFEAETGAPDVPAMLPRALDAATTAAWIAAALAGEQPVPQPIVNQLACCLLSTRRAPDAA
jgi:anthranilate phosphoribosyltransferase